MQIPTDVLEVLDRAETDGPRLILTGTLDRKLYTTTAKAIEAAGGKWNRKAGAHLFDGDAADAIEPLLLTGQVISQKQATQYYPTPAPVVAQLLELADIQPGMEVLEPSAGRGAIAVPLAQAGAVVTCVENEPGNAAHLRSLDTEYDVAPGIHDPGRIGAVSGLDFLTVLPDPDFDRVVMNPPFTRQADLKHVTHAYAFLKPGGRLVAVMSNGITFRNTGPYQEFRTLLDSADGQILPLPEGAFKDSGTGVNTVVVVMTKPA